MLCQETLEQDGTSNVVQALCLTKLHADAAGSKKGMPEPVLAPWSSNYSVCIKKRKEI